MRIYLVKLSGDYNYETVRADGFVVDSNGILYFTVKDPNFGHDKTTHGFKEWVSFEEAEHGAQ